MFPEHMKKERRSAMKLRIILMGLLLVILVLSFGCIVGRPYNNDYYPGYYDSYYDPLHSYYYVPYEGREGHREGFRERTRGRA